MTSALRLLVHKYMRLRVMVHVGNQQKGTVKYNRDAFIVIKNRDRSPYTPICATTSGQ